MGRMGCRRRSRHPAHNVWLGVGLVLVLLGVLPAAAGAMLSSVPDDDWVTNGPVTAVAGSGNTVYLGGFFSQIGPRTGPAVSFTSESSTPDAGFPEVSGGLGIVDAVVSDGAGGWYIAGNFTHVGGAARDGLAHVLSGGSVDPSFVPNPELTEVRTVSALALSGGALYIGGDFTKVNGTARNGLAAVNTSDGSLTGFNPAPSSGSVQIQALAVASGVLYAGGSFTEMGGQARAGLAAFTVSTGALTSWAPQATGIFPTVRALAVSGSTIYLAGYFDHISGEPRSGFAAVDTSGVLQPWNPEASGCATPGLALAVSATAVYVGGCFTSIGGQARVSFAALDPTTAKATSWNPEVSGGTVEGIAVSGSTVYASGSFTGIGGQARNGLAALDAGTAAASGWNPNLNLNTNPGETTEVPALAASGSTVFVGGDFTSVGGVSRTDLAAIDTTSGEATAWNPGLTPYFPLSSVGESPIRALAVAGGVVYVGGTFSSTGGQPRADLAALDATTGAATSWNPGVSSASSENTTVGALIATPSTVYVGGSFTTLGSSARSDLGALSTSTGLATAWNPQLTAVKADTEHGTAAVDTLALSGNTLYVGGGLTSAGGHTRTAAAAFSTETGEATGWDPLVEVLSGTPYASGLAISGSTVYIAAGTGGLLPVDATTGAAREAYAPPLASDPVSVATANSAVYLAGSAFDSGSGLALAWHVPLSAFTFGTPTTAATVLASGNHVYLAGHFRSTELAPASGFAAFTITGPINSAPPTITGTVGEGQLLSEHHGSWSEPPTAYSYQWLRCPHHKPAVPCTPIAGATDPTYTLTAADSGATIEVQETATNAAGSSDPVGSLPTAVVAEAPGNLTPPAITGTPSVDETLSCSHGTWNNSPSSYAYAWLRDGEPIPGATSSNYLVTASDVGYSLSCEVTAGNAGGSRAAASSTVTITAGGGGTGEGGGPTGGGGSGAAGSGGSSGSTGGGSASGVPTGSGAQTNQPGPSPSAVIAALATLLSTRTPPPTITGVLAHGYSVTFNAPGAGVLSIRWTTAGGPGAHHAKSVVIARGSRSFGAAERGVAKLRLTAAGRKLLGKGKTLKVIEVVGFTPSDADAQTKRVKLTIRRRR